MTTHRPLDWCRRHPLVICLPVQAALLFAALGHLPIWGDEQSSLDRAALPYDEMARVLQTNVHPMLYFLLLRGWLALPWAAEPIVRARALSALIMLLATLAVDRCWLRRLDARSRAWFLALWTLSPALLLYGRMARSYSLQLLLACLTLAAGLAYLRRASAARAVAYAALAGTLLYVHYLPGVALIAALTLVGGWNAVRARAWTGLAALGAPLLLIALAYLAWAPVFAGAVARVGGQSHAPLFGSRLADGAAALAFAGVSFTIGEALHPWMLVAALALAPGVLVLVAYGAHQQPPWLAPVAVAALIAFAGAVRWVSYAFVAGRLLFLLPFALLLLVLGGRRAPRLRAAVGLGLLIVSLGGVHAYFTAADFLNQAYVIPAGEISARIAAGTGAAPPSVIFDHHSANLGPVMRALPPGAHTVLVAGPADLEAVAALAAQPADVIWFVRSAHDSSPDGLNRRIEAYFAGFDTRRSGFAPYSTVDRWLMQLLGWPHPPANAVELLEWHRPAAAGEG
ncbi:MAG: hypothetical protein ACRERC_17890 [Candidatus Binatia bacterium]